MRAILVSVEYGDLLGITLPYNRHHFEDVMVVTTPQDEETIKVAKECNARLHLTRAFYEDGAIFNKWKALEEGLDAYGRHGDLCIMDADILWPKQIPFLRIDPGVLYGPHRYIWPDVRLPVPHEREWPLLSCYTDYEFPGYTQIFSAESQCLPKAPWHETDWTHAGGADSAFQNLWPRSNRVRLSWPALHLGRPWENWGGRAGHRVDGKPIPLADARRKAIGALLAQRRRDNGIPDYSAERIPGNRSVGQQGGP